MKYFSQALPASIAMLVVASASLFSPSVALAGCDGVAPKAPSSVWASSGPGPGQVTISWAASDWANRYAVEYGTKTNSYIYGANNIGGQAARSYTVNALQPGQTYYFRVAAAHDCNSSGFSYEVSAPAAGGAVSMDTQQVTMAEAKRVATAMVDSMLTANTPAPVVVSQSQASAWSGPVGREQLSAKSGPGVGEVTIYWKDVESADNFHVTYGTGGSYQYGALNVGKSGWFKISHLVPGMKYNVSIVPVRGSRALYTNEPVWIAAMPSEMPVTTPVLGVSDERPIEEQQVVEQAAPVVEPESYAQPEDNSQAYVQEQPEEYMDQPSEDQQVMDQAGTGSTEEAQEDYGAQQSDY